MTKRKLTAEDIASVEGLSSRMAASMLGVGKTTVNDYRALYGAPVASQGHMARILTIDIESKPMQGYFWQPKTEYISSQFITDDGGMLCFAAKWLGEDEVLFYSDWGVGHDLMVRAAHDLLSQADIVVTYNGDRYDFKRLNNEFLKLKMPPPKPYRSIDLIKTNRAKFDLPYKKLDYLLQVTGTGEKVKHSGFDLWLDTMAGDKEAQALMREYNVGDVVMTEKMYTRLLPWLHNVPHMGMFVTDGLCPYCGSSSLIDVGETATAVQKYELFECNSCEGYSRGNKPVASPLKTRKV